MLKFSFTLCVQMCVAEGFFSHRVFTDAYDVRVFHCVFTDACGVKVFIVCLEMSLMNVIFLI